MCPEKLCASVFADSDTSFQLANSYYELLEYVTLLRRPCVSLLILPSHREFSSKELRTVGNYTLGRLIGKGSFGKVYLATHKLTNGSKACVSVLQSEDILGLIT